MELEFWGEEKWTEKELDDELRGAHMGRICFLQRGFTGPRMVSGLGSESLGRRFRRESVEETAISGTRRGRKCVEL